MNKYIKYEADLRTLPVKSKTELNLSIFNSYKPLTNIAKSSALNNTEVLDLSL